jgi:hypothetical protein
MRKRIEENITCMKYIDVLRLIAYLNFPSIYCPTPANYLTEESTTCLEVLPLLVHISGQILEFEFGSY